MRRTSINGLKRPSPHRPSRYDAQIEDDFIPNSIFPRPNAPTVFLRADLDLRNAAMIPSTSFNLSHSTTRKLYDRIWSCTEMSESKKNGYRVYIVRTRRLARRFHDIMKQTSSKIPLPSAASVAFYCLCTSVTFLAMVTPVCRIWTKHFESKMSEALGVGLYATFFSQVGLIAFWLVPGIPLFRGQNCLFLMGYWRSFRAAGK